MKKKTSSKASSVAERLDELESKYDKQFRQIFDAIREMMIPVHSKSKREIGFKIVKNAGKS